MRGAHANLYRKEEIEGLEKRKRSTAGKQTEKRGVRKR